jgi:hypothetical protein
VANNYFDLPPIGLDDVEPGTRDYDILEWCDNRLKRGIRFVEESIGYDKISIALDELFSYEKSSMASYVPGAKSPLSSTRANLIPKIAEDLTAMLTDTRMFWNYRTQNPKYMAQCRLSNKSAEIWYNRRQIDLRIADIMRYYTISGTGFGHLYYSRRLDDLMLDAEDPRNVFPIDPMSYHTVQECLGVITRRPRTPEWIKEEYGKDVDPDDDGGLGSFFGWIGRNLIDGPGERGGPLSKKTKADKKIPGTPTVFANTMYLKDSRTNKTGKILRLGPWEEGKPLAPWSYEVRPREPIFPFGRMVVWGNKKMLYDNTSPYWMAKFPLIKFTLNPWPMSWFGKAPLWDCIPLNTSINNNLRVIDDHCAQVAQPGAVGDRNVSRAEMDKFNTRAPGYKIRTNMASGKGITVVNPPPLDQLIWEVIKWCQETMQKISGTADPSAMASLAQIPSDDTIDTIMKAMTPGVRLRSRILEGCFKDLAEMFLWCNAEWDSMMKRIVKLGPDAVTKEDYDYNPKTFIPDNVPDGEPGDIAGLEGALALDNPGPSLHERAKVLLDSIACEFDPSSLLNTAAQQELMRYFMLAKMGYCSVFTLMDKMGIMNFAPPGLTVPPDEIGRLKLQQALGIGMIANAQGRKSTDSAAPAMGQNSNGPTITTS